MGGGRLSLGGVATPNGIVRESSFFDVYRVLDESRFEVSIFQHRYTGNSPFLSSPGESGGIGDTVFRINPYDNNYQHFLIETFPRLCMLADLQAFSGVYLNDLDEKRINVPCEMDLVSFGNTLRDFRGQLPA